MESFHLIGESKQVSAGASKQMSPNEAVSPDAKGNLASSRPAGNNLPEIPNPTFTPEQEKAIQLLARLDPKLKDWQVGKEIGRTDRTIRNWRKDITGFQGAVDQQTEKNRPQLRGKALRTHSRILDSRKDTAAIAAVKLVYQLLGDMPSDGVHVHQETHVAASNFADFVSRLRVERGLPPLRTD